MIYLNQYCFIDNYYNGWGNGPNSLAIAVMPLLGIGGGQIYKTEVPGAMGEQRLTPRIKETAQALWIIYLGINSSLWIFILHKWNVCLMLYLMLCQQLQ